MAAKIVGTVATVFIFIGVLFTLIGCFTDAWYEIEFSFGATTATTQAGLFRSCTETGGTKVCQKSVWTDQAGCPDRTGKKMKMRMDATAALLIIGCIVAFCAVAAVVMAACTHNAKARRVGVPLLLMTLLLFLAGMLLYVYSMSGWYFCGDGPCDVLGAGATCSYRYSFGLVCAGIGCIFVALILFCVLVKLSKPPEHGAYRNESSSPTSGGKSQAYPVPSGYVYDPDSAMYWSDAEDMYWDPGSDHYYHSGSEMWYDPHAAAWYTVDASGRQVWST